MEKGSNILESIYEFIKEIITKTKASLEKLRLDAGISGDLLGLKKILQGKETKGNESEKADNTETSSNKENNDNDNNKNNSGESELKPEGKEEAEKEVESQNNKETPTEDLSTEKLKSFFENNATNLSIDKIDNKDFFEVSYVDKNSGSKVWGVMPNKWNGNSNIYMPGDRSGIKETLKQKKFLAEITNKDSKKARFIFEGDADKINGNQKSARYNNVINKFEDMISPMKLADNNPKINIVGHSRAGATVNKLIGKYYGLISNYIIIDGTYGIYKNVMQSEIPGKIFYTNGGGTKKYINNYKNKSNLEVSGDYANLGHEAIVPKVLFDTSSTNQDLFG